MSMTSKVAAGIAALLFIGLSGQQAFAQAWVGQSQALSASLDYSYAPSDRVIEEADTASEIPSEDPISSHSMALSLEYNPIDKLALQAAVPLVTTHYGGETGPMAVFPPHGAYDNGDYHTALQDFRLAARYMVLDDPVAISPHVGVSVPLTNYETVGFAAAGRGLNQLHLGLSIGKFFVSGVPNLYLHGTYEFSLVEGYETAFPETGEYGQSRSDIKGLVGYFITDKLEVNLATDLRIAHGGFKFIEWEDVSEVVHYYHDALLAENFFLVGAGVSYQVTESIRLSALFRYWLRGSNTRDTNLLGLGVGWDIM